MDKFDSHGVETPVYINEFWTSKQRAASSLHEISYRACYKPQLPKFFIERLTLPGDAVYDPFMGRGTTLLEAAFHGREPVGCDINPLSKILLQPRLSPPNLQEVEQRLLEISTVSKSAEQHEELLTFYHPVTLQHILALREYFIERERSGTIDHIDAWIRMVATNRLTGHSVGFFSVYTLPPNQAVSVESQKKINEKRQQVPPERDVNKIILKKSRSLLNKVDPVELVKAREVKGALLTGSAENTPVIPDESVKLVVTSPPFLDVIDYKHDNWLRCWFNGMDSSEISIWQLRKIEDWVEKMSEVFAELARVLKPDGYIAFEVGDVKGGKVMMEDLVVPAAAVAGLEPELILINDQKFTKTANCWGVNNQSKGTNTNRIILLKKLQLTA